MQDLREVIQTLLFQYPNVVVKNIDSDQHQILEMLDSLPFKVVANQYEMTRIFS